MPRTEGVSSSSRVAVPLVQAQADQGRFLVEASAPDDGLPVCVTLILSAWRAWSTFSLTPSVGVAGGRSRRLPRMSLTPSSTALRGDRARRLQTVRFSASNVALNHVVRVRGADRLGHDVLEAERLEHRAHRTAGDDARALPAPRAARPCRRRNGRCVVVQRAAFAQRHADHAALGLVGRLADRLGHLARLAGAVADAALGRRRPRARRSRNAGRPSPPWRRG